MSTVISLADAEDAIIAHLETLTPKMTVDSLSGFQKLPACGVNPTALVFFVSDSFRRKSQAAWDRFPTMGIKVGAKSLRSSKNHRGGIRCS